VLREPAQRRAALVLFTAVIVVPLLAWRAGLSAVASFWFAYILTRPVGASFADYLGFGHNVGGAGLGHGPVALAACAAFALLIGVMAATGSDRPAEPLQAEQGLLDNLGQRRVDV
jgi:uncharacterized membrane-anchored protein